MSLRRSSSVLDDPMDSDAEPNLPSPNPKRRRHHASRCHSNADISRPFWKEDGDLILAMESARLRVHSQRLMLSDVFAGMLQFPQPPDAEHEEGCPLVQLADSALDWLATLRCLYNSSLSMPSPVMFDALAGALRISSKYEILPLRSWIVGELEQRWPLDLKQMDTTAFPHAAEVISLSRQCDVPSILPCAFYALSIPRWRDGADGWTSHTTLSPNDLRRFISGREALSSLTLSWTREPLAEMQIDGFVPCQGCAQVLNRAWRTGIQGEWLVKELQRLDSSADGLLVQGVCADCLICHRAFVRQRLTKLEASVPVYFLLQ